jgi:hypothetical protein
MPDCFAAEIRIGGKICHDLVPGLYKAIREERLSFDWGNSCFDPNSVAVANQSL